VLWAERAREEHDSFVGQLTERGVVAHQFAALLAEALVEPGAREFLQERLTTATRFGLALDGPLDELVATTPAAQMAELLIGGVLKRDVKSLISTSSLLMEYLADEDFMLRPLSNHLSRGTTRRGSTGACPSTRWPSRRASGRPSTRE
jgi:arginine deiminase